MATMDEEICRGSPRKNYFSQLFSCYPRSQMTFSNIEQEDTHDATALQADETLPEWLLVCRLALKYS